MPLCLVNFQKAVGIIFQTDLFSELIYSHLLGAVFFRAFWEMSGLTDDCSSHSLVPGNYLAPALLPHGGRSGGRGVQGRPGFPQLVSG